jgi:hypothetical protein
MSRNEAELAHLGKLGAQIAKSATDLLSFVATSVQDSKVWHALAFEKFALQYCASRFEMQYIGSASRSNCTRRGRVRAPRSIT